jgi:hypothetical protein
MLDYSLVVRETPLLRGKMFPVLHVHSQSARTAFGYMKWFKMLN